MPDNDDAGRAKCLSKYPFKTRAKAQENAVILTRRGNGKVQPFKCKFCKFWHVGTVRTLKEQEKRSRLSGGNVPVNPSKRRGEK